jgi:hypothetical protein
VPPPPAAPRPAAQGPGTGDGREVVDGAAVVVLGDQAGAPASLEHPAQGDEQPVGGRRRVGRHSRRAGRPAASAGWGALAQPRVDGQHLGAAPVPGQAQASQRPSVRRAAISCNALLRPPRRAGHRYSATAGFLGCRAPGSDEGCRPPGWSRPRRRAPGGPVRSVGYAAIGHPSRCVVSSAVTGSHSRAGRIAAPSHAAGGSPIIGINMSVPHGPRGLRTRNHFTPSRGTWAVTGCTAPPALRRRPKAAAWACNETCR